FWAVLGPGKRHRQRAFRGAAAGLAFGYPVTRSVLLADSDGGGTCDELTRNGEGHDPPQPIPPQPAPGSAEDFARYRVQLFDPLFVPNVVRRSLGALGPAPMLI